MPSVGKLSTAAARKVRDTCVCLHLQRAARTVVRHYDEALRPLALTVGQFSVLMALNRPEPPSVSQVAGDLAMDRTTMTAALKPLERRGLVRTGDDPTDRRTRLVSLTDAGHALLREAYPRWEAAQGSLGRDLGADGDLDVLRAQLRALG